MDARFFFDFFLHESVVFEKISFDVCNPVSRKHFKDGNLTIYMLSVKKILMIFQD